MRLWYGQDGFEGQTTHTALPIPHAGESNYQHGPVRVIVASGRPVAAPVGNGNPIHVQPVPQRRRKAATAPGWLAQGPLDREVRVFRCEDCGVELESTSPNAKRCQACSRKRQREQQAKWMREKRGQK